MSHAVLSFFVCGLSASCTHLGASQESAAPEKLSLEACVELSRSLRPRKGAPRGWMGDGARYLTVQEPEGKDGPPAHLAVIDAAAGTSAPLFDAERLRAALAAQPGVDAQEALRWSTRTNFEFTAA